MLGALFLILAAVATAGIYLGVGVSSLSLWWSLPILIGCYLGVIVLYFVFLIIASLFLPSKKKPIKKPNAYCRFMIVLTMRYLMGLLRIRLRFHCDRELPQEPCVVISNHISAIDPLTLLATLKKRNIVYICKESVLRIPLVGRYIYNAGFVGINRENGMKALRTLHRAAEEMKTTGVDVGIFPEGTRSRTGELLRFKTGAFVLAKNAQSPIVVMTTTGTDRVFKRFPWRSTRVELKVLDVIGRETVEALSADELCEQARAIIEQK